MAKKKKPTSTKKQSFGRNPFSNLKGFTVSDKEVANEEGSAVSDVVKEEPIASFAEEMRSLGVERINAPMSDEAEPLAEEPVTAERECAAGQSEEEQFLQAMGDLQVNFSDRFPEQDKPPTASARRMKQLKQGKLVPEGTLDLHGLKRIEVAEKLQFFLQNAGRQGWQTVLVITGRGLHSAAGEPVLRNETERYLAADGGKLVVEWGRAPKQFGGDGALVLFLRKKEQ